MSAGTASLGGPKSPYKLFHCCLLQQAGFLGQFYNNVQLHTCHGIRASWADITSDHKLSGLKRQKLIPSRFWRPEVQNHDIGKATLPLEAVGENPSFPLPASGDSRSSLACGRFTANWHPPSRPSPLLPASPLLSLPRILVSGFRTHLDHP